MSYLASDSMGGVALYNPSTGVYSSSPNPRSPNTIALLESKIAEGFRPITDFDTPEGKQHLQYFMEKSDQPASMLKREKSFDSSQRVTNVLKNLLGNVTGKALGILDILGMKKELEDIQAGESLINELIPTLEEYSEQTFKDGGYVSSNPIVEDIFDID